MTSRRPAGCVAQRRTDWSSVQAARRRLRAFWTSPLIEIQSVGAALYARLAAPQRLDRRPVCLRHWRARRAYSAVMGTWN